MSSLFGSKTNTSSSTTTTPFSGEWATRADDLWKQYAGQQQNPNSYSGNLSAGTNNLQQNSYNNINNIANNSAIAKLASGSGYTGTVTTPINNLQQNAADSISSLMGNSTLNNMANGNNTYTGTVNSTGNDLQTGSYDYIKSMLGNQTLNDLATGKMLDPSSNPYLQKSGDLASAALDKSMGQTYNDINSRFGGTNRLFNSSAKRDMAMRAANDLGTQKDTMLNNLYGNAYTNGISQMMNAVGAQSGLAGQANTMGNNQQALDQAGLDRLYQVYKDNNAQTMNAIGQQSSLAGQESAMGNNQQALDQANKAQQYQVYKDNNAQTLNAVNQQAALAGQQNTMGNSQQALDQAAQDRTYKEWLRQQGVSDDKMNAMMQLLSLNKNPTQTTTGSSSSPGLLNGLI